MHALVQQTLPRVVDRFLANPTVVVNVSIPFATEYVFAQHPHSLRVHLSGARSTRADEDSARSAFGVVVDEASLADPSGGRYRAGFLVCMSRETQRAVPRLCRGGTRGGIAGVCYQDCFNTKQTVSLDRGLYDVKVGFRLLYKDD